MSADRQTVRVVASGDTPPLTRNENAYGKIRCVQGLGADGKLLERFLAMRHSQVAREGPGRLVPFDAHSIAYVLLPC